MTVQTTEPDRAATAWSDEAEVDLRQYIEVLIRWRREIVLITLGAVILAIAAMLALQWMSAPMYQASAEVAIVRTVSDVQFDERFITQPEETTATSASTRRLALVVLASSPAVAQEVITQLQDQLEENERNVDRILGMVNASVSSPDSGPSGDSDLIRIRVTADTPEKAAAIANVWAEVFVRQANMVFGQVPNEQFASVQAEMEKARSDYVAAQTNVEQFLANSPYDELTRLITEQQTLINAYSESSTANRLTAFYTEQVSQRDILSAYLDTIKHVQEVVFEEQATRNTDLLRNYYSSWITTTLALNDAQALRIQVEQGGDAAARSSALALQVLKVNLYGGTKEPIDLQLPQATATTAAEMLRDIDGVVASLETRRDDLEQQIEELTTVMLSGDNFTRLNESMPENSPLAKTVQQVLPSLFALGDFTRQSEAFIATEMLTGTLASNALTQKQAELQAELRALKVQLEAASAQQLQLTQQRDLAWETFKALNNKVAELNLTRAASNSEVRFAANAVPPADPVQGPSLLLAVAAAGTGGLMIAIFIALVANYLNQPPFFTRNRRQSAMVFGQ